ncbi:uncharacterized protein YutE (UPF0331/DUF86 family) [Dysgonomonas sp. PFB1-18]|uniref:hypothetical protein n=1 Tax=unclassified Dysgonomonas TaxID=2630389 RepID=UPI00247595CB|nr:MULTISPECIES: hypothetical protein [unclassified Dysgonomonas]MDH6307827.1 uncharacterized protein YutE (UPF0331/DUF86 family) [Dysgonomonas sp. PF1-14]MDH6337745.1 uncharacterized protein YutE (UPF0331/DUF86 family) [Dysgonomonas sp. PF1-16]MDH6378969.1 uncharacterized protein YutE (UPF0331/DUF86 family) [Dysgonomonas sp. PFB1-18]MDH6396604.1 uncharacterized protein YutE (UPF0331/DUF86 family) [Dysgonomonas sp. PF1-23]
MTDKIKELRKLVPVPMGEALQLLKANDGDVEKCAYLFKAKSIKEIQELTGCDEKMASTHYEAEKYDLNRTVSSIREAIFDICYIPIEGVTKEKLSLAYQWLRFIEDKDFGTALDYKFLNEAIETMLLIPSLADVAQIARKAKEAKDRIFEGYSDTDPLDEFVRRYKQLDDEKDYQLASKTISLRLTILKDELARHARNL